MGLLATIRERQNVRGAQPADAEPAPEPAQATPEAAAPPEVEAAPASPDNGSSVDAETADKLARLSTAVDGMREKHAALEERLVHLDEQVGSIAALAETLTAQYNPFADAGEGSERTLVVADGARDAAPVSPEAEPDAVPEPAPEAAAPPAGDVRLDAVPSSVRGDVLLAEWAAYLVTAGGRDEARRAVRGYVQRGWIGRDVAATLTRHVDATDATSARDARPADPVETAWTGRMFIALLAGMGTR